TAGDAGAGSGRAVGGWRAAEGVSLPRAPGLNQLERGDRAPEATPPAARAPEMMAHDKIQCDACPVLCQISEGRLGACARWGNVGGRLSRTEPVVLMRLAQGSPKEDTAAGGETAAQAADVDTAGDDLLFVSGVASGTT